MGQLSIRLADSLAENVRELARREGVSINQYVVTVLAADLARRELWAFLERKAGKAPRRKTYEKLMGKVPAKPVREGDEL